MKRKPKKYKATEDKYYINDQEFLVEAVLSQEQGVCTEKFGVMLLELHKHILRRSEFATKPFDEKEELQSYSLYRILKRGIYTFKKDSTPRECFNYFTRAAIINMKRRAMTLATIKQKRINYIDECMKLAKAHNISSESICIK